MSGMCRSSSTMSGCVLVHQPRPPRVASAAVPTTSSVSVVSPELQQLADVDVVVDDAIRSRGSLAVPARLTGSAVGLDLSRLPFAEELPHARFSPRSGPPMPVTYGRGAQSVRRGKISISQDPSPTAGPSLRRPGRREREHRAAVGVRRRGRQFPPCASASTLHDVQAEADALDGGALGAGVLVEQLVAERLGHPRTRGRRRRARRTPGRPAARTRSVYGGRPYLRALLTRLCTICSSRRGSATTLRASSTSTVTARARSPWERRIAAGSTVGRLDPQVAVLGLRPASAGRRRRCRAGRPAGRSRRAAGTLGLVQVCAAAASRALDQARDDRRRGRAARVRWRRPAGCRSSASSTRSR